MIGFEADTLTQYLTYGLQQAGFRRGLPGRPVRSRSVERDAQ
jgi:hypothetical protein